MCIFAALLSIGLVVKFKKPELGKIKLPSVYEIPFILIFLLLIIISVWRCFYLPASARDMLSGPEVMAKYAVSEKSMINSMFSVDLHTTNNYLKPPFVTSLQIIYKLFVSEIGQLWISVLFVSFIIWLYDLLRANLNPLIAGIILLFFITLPEVYAYTYLMLFDYSNMVFFFAGFYFLARYRSSRQFNELAFSALMFALATYIRTETLVLQYMAVPMLIYFFYKDKTPLKQTIKPLATFMMAPLFFYILCMTVFVKHYIPIHFDVSGEINKHLGDVSVFFERFSDMNSVLIFSDMGKTLYGYFIPMFIVVLIADIIFFRKQFSIEAKVALYGVLVVYIGMPLLGYLLPLVDLRNTTKRGLFKIFPLMVLYLRNSGSLIKLSTLINNWEFSKPKDEVDKRMPQVATTQSKGNAKKK